MRPFPVDTYIDGGGLTVTRKAWCKFCIKVAKHDTDNLSEVLAIAQNELGMI